MHVILVPVGTPGDVYPHIWLGRGLKARGHQVTIITSGYFEPLVRRIGLDFCGLGTEKEYQAVINDPNIWHPKRYFKVVAQRVVPQMLPPTYEAIVERHVPNDTVIAACGFGFAARIAHDKLGIPLATVHLQPEMFRSEYESPLVSGLPVRPWMPRLWKRAVFNLADALVADRLLGPPINAFRSRLGLPPVRRILGEWWNSPQRVIGLFPDWFGRPQPDWPAQTRLTSFPLCDAGEVEPIPPGVEEFLAAGEPPVVFTPGSPIQNWDWFFDASVKACVASGRRGILLTRDRTQVPRSLPATVQHFDYVPFSFILGKSAALVHHAGIGTLAQGLAAGIPQLVMPFTNDQPDNAARLLSLGVALAIKPGDYHGTVVARCLNKLLGVKSVADACRDAAVRLESANPLSATCEIIEGLLPSPARQVARAS
ncbi:MAG TPA: glycosyltransferase [Phycisphaerae bacterium]|nr:glycosyltransferase [Phycisphaerae bacterium]HRY67198.1 glycosyltransferase [Phycisphaerae bacterium]HSA26432.1 glycosyltransferase [Phycisphaerae bacterium]